MVSAWKIELALKNPERAAASAEYQARAVLKRVDALSGEPPNADPDYFYMYESVPKPSGTSYKLYIENFERVPAGTACASVDEEDLIADEPFWPILMSEHGFSDIFGYKGQH